MFKNYISINDKKIINEVYKKDIDLNKSREAIFPSYDINSLKGGNHVKFLTHKENGMFFNKTQNILKLKEFIKNENKANNCRTFKFEFPLLGINYENATMKECYDSIEILKE